MNVPFFKNAGVDIGWGYVAFGALVVVGCANAVNLTDGLDGLAIGCTLIVGFVFLVFTYLAGNVKAGNRINVLTRWQSIEYISSQNLDRRAYAYLNAITVVPGAVGAWRRTAVVAVGGYLTDTMAEDMELTYRLRRAGWRITADTETLGYTEAPATFRAFFSS